ncbi:hypothetical protein N0V88_004798 [Collariella sp. IMI 366227]|nr:hypothetical protein N0V88_004798 [Collariella sp. IMI 366227]
MNPKRQTRGVQGDSTVIATATPQITDEFRSLADVGWYASIYPMAICMSQLLYALIAGRAVSGLGSSGLLVGAYSLVPFLAPPAKRPILLSFLGVARGLAVTFGPLIGGALTERVSWRWNFYINLPLGAFTYAVFLLTVRPPKRQSEGFTSWTNFIETLDLLGFAAITASVVCLLLALQWGGIQYPWNDARIIALLVLFGALGVAFLAIEIRQGPKAMLPSRVFTQRTVAFASFFAFLTTGAIFVLTFYLPIWFQAVKGYSPIQSGVNTLPWVITSTIAALAGGVLISKLGYAQLFMVVATVFGSVGSGLFTTFTVDTATGKWIGFQIIYAVGSSLASLTPLTVAQNALPLQDVPIGSGMLIAIFTSVAQALFTNYLTSGLARLGMAGADASAVTSGGLTSTLTEGLSGEDKRAVLGAVNNALIKSWLLPVVLSCVSIVGALGVEHRKMKTEGTV